MSRNESRPVLSADLCFLADRWHLHWTEENGDGLPQKEIKHKILHCRGQVNGRFARREAADFLGCSEKAVLLEEKP